jgi:hypothetical protein
MKKKKRIATDLVAEENNQPKSVFLFAAGNLPLPANDCLCE